MKRYVGIDIGGTTVKAAIVTQDGKIEKRSTIPTKATRPYGEIIADIAWQVKSLAEGTKVEGVGIGCPGMIDSRRGIVNYSCNLFWSKVPLADELSRLVGLPVKVSNDANVAALGEARFGAGKEFTDTAFVTLGTGVGGGFVVDGKLFEGFESMGAEIGHTVIYAGGTRCGCGRRGCWEAYASATALTRDTIFAMMSDKNSAMWEYAGGDLDKVDGSTSFECAKKGDRAATEVVDNYVRYLADGITNIVNVFRSQAIILGGGVCAQGEYLTSRVQKLVDEECYGGSADFRTLIKTATLGNDAGILGAASLLMVA